MKQWATGFWQLAAGMKVLTISLKSFKEDIFRFPLQAVLPVASI